MRLERQQELQKKHLKELREFAEAFADDRESVTSSDRERTSGERSSSMTSDTNASVGMMSL